MSNELKLIDVSAVRANMEAGIWRNKLQLNAVKRVIEALKAHEGKQITARIATALSKEFPEYHIRLSKSHSWWELTISSVGGEAFNSADLNIGYFSQTKVIDHAEIVKQNQRHLLDEIRIPQFEEELKTVEARAERWNAAVLELKAAAEGLGSGKHFYTANIDTYIRARDENGRIIS